MGVDCIPAVVKLMVAFWADSRFRHALKVYLAECRGQFGSGLF
jgi:hypothetical protein